MRSYTPDTYLGSVTHDYLSGVYCRISDLLSSLRRGVVDYLSKSYYNINIARRLRGLEAREQKLYELSMDRVGEIAGNVVSIFQQWERCAGPLKDTLSEIRVAWNNGEPLEPYTDRLEELMGQLPK